MYLEVDGVYDDQPGEPVNISGLDDVLDESVRLLPDKLVNPVPRCLGLTLEV